MKALIICPAERPLVAELATHAPLVALPLLGRSLIEAWIDKLAADGAQEIVILASDRPACIRHILGEGRQWGVQIELVPTVQEYSFEEARSRFGAEYSIHLADHVPGYPELPMFESYAGWFEAATAWMPHAATPYRIGVREIKPGIWVGLRAEIAPTARLKAPCWIGTHAVIGPDTEVGPYAVVDDRSILETGARVIDGYVGPDTYVGKFVSVGKSIALHSLLVSWVLDSAVLVPDPMLLADLSERRSSFSGPSLAGRFAAAAAMLVTAPVAAAIMSWALIRGEPPWHLRLAVRSRPGLGRRPYDTFVYYELTGARSWLRRWPQFWNIVRGEMRWTGNRPIGPVQAMALANDFERLWLAAPVGLISLADAYGCQDGLSNDAIAHGSYYAVHASRRLDWHILAQSLLQSALIWPIRGMRRRDAAMPLQDLVHKQEI